MPASTTKPSSSRKRAESSEENAARNVSGPADGSSKAASKRKGATVPDDIVRQDEGEAAEAPDDAMEIDEDKAVAAKNGKGKKSETAEDIEEQEAPAAGDDDDDNESLGEEEYEIEAILSHVKKPGKGGFKYLVSWLDYGPEHNSYVEEADFGSPDLVESYWAKHGGRPGNKPSKSAGTPTSGRNTKRHAASPIDVDSDNQPTASKRARRDPGAAVSGKTGLSEAEDMYETVHTDSMDAYKNLKDWEDKVKSIETIERGQNQKLIVYMIMIGGEKTAQQAEVVYKRCPMKMFKFYEDHLKWKSVP